MKKLLFLFILMLSPMLVSADAVEIGGIYYNLTEGTKVAELTKNPQQYNGDITIPESVEHEGITYSVTKIGYSAFANCTGLTSVMIPSSVMIIGQMAFDGCSSLNSATIPGSVSSIEAWAFHACTSLSSIAIPNSVTSIGNRAFQDCSSLTSIIIPNSVMSIGYNAFQNCTSLTSVTISNSVTSIGESTFQNCFSLASVTIPNSVTKIDGLAFRNCSNLASVTLPNSVTEICKEAFCNCTSLASISIPNSVTRIERHAFAACNALTSVTIGNGVKIIEGHAFYGCDAVTSVHISDLESFCKISFGDSWSNPLYFAHHFILNGVEVKDLVIPNSVTSIGDYTFYRCSDLASITIPNSVTNIERYAFAYCSGVTSITIGSKVESIGSYAFNECQMLSNLYCYAENVPKTQSYAFRNINIGDVTLHVPAASLSKYQAAGPWKNFKEIVALSPQDDYLPFVDMGKQWNVVSTVANPNSSCHFERYRISEEIERDGKTYFRVLQSEENLTVMHDAGLYREENRRVYKYDEMTGRDVMLYDFSLKEGDTFTYEMGMDNPVNCKVLKLGWLDDGPIVVSPDNSADTKYRHLRTWTIGRDNGSGEYDEITTWVECVGALENMFNPFASGKRSRLAYIDYRHDMGEENAYLPFSLCDIYDVRGQIHGCNMPTGAADKMESEDWHHRLTYELEGDRLHVYGKIFCCCGGCHYVYFYEEQTDDPLVHKLHFEIRTLADAMACQAHYPTDFYVPGFNPNYDYIVVDDQGEEHPVINKTLQNEYRPLVEEGKVWTYHYQGFNGREFNVGRVIDCDTIIGELTYKKIYDKVGGQYQYALREEGKKIYIVYPNYETASLLYDFSKNVGDVINELAYPLIVASVDTIDIDGVKFRRMRVQDADKPVEEWRNDLINMYNFWIEGVGSESLLEASIREPGNAYNLLSCQINGRVYTQQELLGIVSKPSPQMEYRPFVEEGKVWKVGDTSVNPVQLVKYYYFDGDTIINGKVCKQMMCQVYYGPNYPDLYLIDPLPDLNYVGAWYEEDKKVYCYNSTNQLRMVYDFSLEANDTLLIDNNYHYVIGPKQTGGLEGFKGVYRDIMWLVGEGTSYCTTWLEGVGGIDGPTTNVYYGKEGRSPFLMSCTVGDEVIYFNDEYEDGATPSEVMGARKNRFDFSHTIKTKPKAPRRSEEQGLYGEYNDLKLGINLDPLDDAYQVRITDESGKVVYEKAINAGNIVGLNIDISAYEKGRYTVTVENSYESFTGEFYAQATGIEAIIYNKVETRNVIYNLQGQRLSSLQKGLNIVNGQKIFVK